MRVNDSELTLFELPSLCCDDPGIRAQWSLSGETVGNKGVHLFRVFLEFSSMVGLLPHELDSDLSPVIHQIEISNHHLTR